MSGGRRSGSIVWKHMTIPGDVQACVKAMLAGEHVSTFATEEESEAWSTFYRGVDMLADVYGSPRIERLPLVPRNIFDRAQNIVILYSHASETEQAILRAGLAEVS